MFSEIQVGDLTLSHRVILAPLTRMRCRNRHPDSMVVEYYRQRATAGGLLISEGIHPSLQGAYGHHTPILRSEADAEKWRPVVEAVHAKGGFIFAQLWHTGRLSHPTYQPSGELPVSSGASASKGKVVIGDGEGNVSMTNFVKPRALETREVPLLVEQFKRSAEMAKLAGFDGVELHAANGYVIDQFIAGNVNDRKDAYGQDRGKLLLEMIDMLCRVWPKGRVGVRLAPGGSYGDVSSTDAPQLFARLCRQLCDRDLAYVHLVEPGTQGSRSQNKRYPGDTRLKQVAKLLRPNFRNSTKLMIAGLLTREKCEKHLEEDSADLFAFGRPFIANPDLPARLKNNSPLNKVHGDKLYGDFMMPGTWAQGYVDYPFLSSKL